MTTQSTTQVPTQEQLQVMYNNFVKISQWLTKKDQAPSPLPPLYADILSELKALRDKVEDLEFKQAANLEEIHYLQSLIERNKTESATSSVAEPEPESKPKKQSRKKKKEEEGVAEEPPSAPILTPAPSQEQPSSAEELSPANETEPSQTETEPEPLDIELDSTVFTSVSEEVSKILDEINKRSEE